MTNPDYQRGYNRGLKRQSQRVSRALVIARGYKQSAGSTGCGQCQLCDRWTRGRAGELTCLWGHCRADFEYMAGEGSMWVDDVNNKAKIATHETFGCINWIPKQ